MSLPTLPFHVAGVVAEMPDDGTDRAAVIRLSAAVSSAWDVVADGEVIGIGDGTTEIPITLPSTSANGGKWTLRHNGQERVSGPMVIRQLATGEPDIEDSVFQIQDGDTILEVTIVEPGPEGPEGPAGAAGAAGAQGPPGVVNATGLATYNSGTQTIDVPTPTAAQVGAVPTSRTINGQALTANVTLTPGDIGAATAAQGTLATNAVQQTRTINGLDLTTNRTLAASDVGADATGTAAARTRVGALGSRPSAAALADGVRYAATDDQGGADAVVSSGAWAPVGAPVNGAARMLAVAEPLSAPTVVCSVNNTDYRVTALTADFVMPAQRVKVDVTELIVYQLGVNTTARVSVWFTTDAWSTKTCLIPVGAPTIAGLAPFYLHRFAVQTALLPVITPGEDVSVAVFLAAESGTPTLTVGADHTSVRTTTRKPYIMAAAI